MKRMYEGKITTNPKQFRIGCAMYEAFSGLEKQQYLTLEAHYFIIRKDDEGILQDFMYSKNHQKYVPVYAVSTKGIARTYLEILGRRKTKNE